MSQEILGIIGGSGLYKLPALKNIEEVTIDTPFGQPSDAYITGTIGNKKVAFLPRHGRDHGRLPHELNYRANIYGFKKLGVNTLISFSAVGSLKEEIVPGHMVIIDQFIDRTKDRPCTFYGNGVVGHVSFADPVCPDLADALYAAVKKAGVTAHKGGTYVCMEGPQFSTRAESHLYRSWGASVIGMTNLTEAKLAKEAAIRYATVAMVTDYDCWHEEEDDVSAGGVMEILRKNAASALDVVKIAIETVSAEQTRSCLETAKQGLITPREAISEENWQRLGVILGKEN